MRIGKIEWYSDRRGFGVIAAVAADGTLDKFYVHVSKIVKSPEKIEQGQRATFTPSLLPPKREHDLPMAVNVTIEGSVESPNTEVRS